LQHPASFDIAFSRLAEITPTLKPNSGCRILGFSMWSTCRDLRLPPHEFDRLMQAAQPIAAADRDAFLKDIAVELGRHEVVGPGLLHRIISEVQQRYDIADQRRSTG
jgi:hypothetical protein